MSDELLKHDKLGNKEELLFFLFNGVPAIKQRLLSDLHKYCISQRFSMARSFWGIVKLCEFISFIQISEDCFNINSFCFNGATFRKDRYLEEFHFFGHLFNSLNKAGSIKMIFNKYNIIFNNKLNSYYVLDSKFPYKFFPLRNLLISTGFFRREASFANQLLIRSDFKKHFKSSVIDKIVDINEGKRRISLKQLKRSLLNKEIVGKEAELCVLEFERNRLQGHPDIESICLLSDDFVNAGYDIQSFDEKDSIILDRFIEVKSYEGEISFHWSKNEVEMAKNLGERYFLYLVNRSGMKDTQYHPKIFQNPYKKIYQNELWKKEPETWKVRFCDCIDD